MKIIEEVKPGLFLQQTKTGWRVVKPIKKDLAKPFSLKNNINWKHFLIGDWNRLILTIIILAIIFFAAWAYNHDINSCAEKYAGECLQARTNKCFSSCWIRCNLATNDLLKLNYNLSNGTTT